MKRHPEEFRSAAATHNITRWPHHDCVICGEWLDYVFINGKVYFDSSCACTEGGPYLHPREWLDIAQHYNIQDPQIKPQMDAFWHFTPATEPSQ